MEQVTILLFVQFDAWIEPHEQYPYYQYCGDYENVLYEGKDITELVKQYPNVELAILEELRMKIGYRRTGRDLLTSFWLNVPVAFPEAIQVCYKEQ